MKSKKLQALVNTYEDLSIDLRQVNSPDLEVLLDSWVLSLNQAQELLDSPNSPVKPSQIAVGFEQGLRETPLILADLPEQIRSSAIKIFYQVVDRHLPSFFEKSRTLLECVVSKGVIKTEKEWHLVRLRVDEIEGYSENESELEILYKLLGDFEANV